MGFSARLPRQTRAESEDAKRDCRGSGREPRSFFVMGSNKHTFWSKRDLTKRVIRMKWSLLLAVVALVIGLVPAAHAVPMSLSECIQEAQRAHPDLRGAHAAVQRADDEARSVRGSYLPVFTAKGNVFVWDDEMSVSLFGEGGMPAFAQPGADQLPQSGFDMYVADQLGALGSVLGSFGDMSSLKLRDQVTWGVTLRATQPLTPLYKVAAGHRARLAQADGARAHVQTVRLDVSMNVATAYYAALQADAYVTIATSAVEQLEAHKKQVEAFFAQGLANKSDVHHVEVELANARQQRIEAVSGRAIAQANLSVQMGHGPASPVVPASLPEGMTVTPAPVDMAQAIAAAHKERTELAEIDRGAKAADEASKAAWGELIPDLDVVAQYDHTAGQGSMSLEDTFFAGLVLKWDFWDWGTSIYAAKAADARQVEVAAQRERVAQLLALDATAKLHRLQSSAEALEVTKAAIVHAKEARRIQRERYAAAVATNTDLLDAEANLTRARANQTNAWYSWLLARAELQRAMGRSISGEEVGS